MERNLKEYQTVVLAAFLHDIGKLLGRGRFALLDKGQHPRFSAEFVGAFSEIFAPVSDVLVTEVVTLDWPWFQAALRNIERHAEASKVEVEIEFDEGKTRISVSDDGKGFELPGSLVDLARVGKLGLAGMEERARLLDGSIRIESQPGKGTTVMVEAPI